MSITTLAKPETSFEIGEAKGKEKEWKDNTILFTISKDESIATILYFKKNPDNTNLELTLQICSLAPVKTLNTINVEWDLDKDGDPTKIYFDEKNNICIEGQNKLITYPYGDQAKVYEVDRKTCLGIS